MELLVSRCGCGPVRVYEVVEKIPEGFYVWNIGDNMEAGWIPLAEDLVPDDKDDYNVNCKTLKAIALPDEEVAILREAAGWGVGSLADCKKALKNNRSGYISNNKRKWAERAIKIFERIS